jgi:hypothetical protein
VIQNPHAEGGTSPPVVTDDLVTTIKLFGVSGSAVEIRIPDAGRDGTVSGYFNLAKKAVGAATEMSGKVPALYITMNPCPSALLGRANNLLKARAKLTTADSDIPTRRWMLIDIDPVRPSGISSTDAEHDAALAMAVEINTWLQTQGFPAGILADSGNGAHVLVRIELPNDAESKALVERCLLALAHHFNTDALKIDTKVFNAARITKFYGTMVCKGDVLPDRPHRLSRILSVPDLLDVCPREAIERLAGMAPSPASKSGYTTTAKEFGASFDIDGYIAQYADQLIMRAPKSWQGGRLWVFDVCPFDQSHEQNGATQLIQHASGAVSVSCHHERCAGKGWPELKVLFPPTRRRPVTEAPDPDGKPTIITNNRDDMDSLHQETFEYVVAFNQETPRVFQRGMDLSRVRRDDDGRPVIESFTESAFTGYLAKQIRWMAWTRVMEGKAKDGTVKMRATLKSVHPPGAVVKNLLSRPEWDGIHRLRGVVQTPVFLKDGTLVTTPGYHASAQLWYDPAPGFTVAVLDAPTVSDVARARELLLEMLADFPFDGAASLAHALAGILLPYCRELIDGPTPLHILDAPTQGAGKGLVIEIGSIMSTGTQAEMVSVPHDDENELRKRITAQLLGGRPYIILDNIDRTLRSAAIASALVSRYWGDRVLGVSEVKRVQNRAVWMATGINVELARDIARRSILCRLEPQEEDPYLRTGFRHPNLIAWVHQHRADLVSAALTLIRAWLAAGRPTVAHPPIGSFEIWADVMSGVLATAEVPGLLENFKETAATVDAEAEEWREFVRGWWDQHQGQPVSAADLVELGRKGIIKAEGGAIALGRALSKKRGRVFAGCQIEKASRTAQEKARWRLVTLSSVTTTPTKSPKATSLFGERIGIEVTDERVTPSDAEGTAPDPNGMFDRWKAAAGKDEVPF